MNTFSIIQKIKTDNKSGASKFKQLAIKEEMKSPDEIWKIEKIDGLEIVNFYFEKVPLPYFTGIITEQSIISPKDISKHL